MSIIIIHDNKKISDLYETNIKAYTDQNTKVFSKAYHALKFMEQNSDYDIVITKKNTDDEACFEKVYKSPIIDTKKVLIICLSAVLKTELYPEVVFLDGAHDLKKVIKAVANKYNITAQMMASKDVGQYYPISVSLLVPNITYSTTLYIEDEDDEGNDIKTVFLEKGELLSQKKYKLIISSVFEVYVSGMDRLAILNDITNKLIHSIRSNRLTKKERIMLTQTGFLQVQNAVGEYGIDKRTTELAFETIDSMKRIVRSSNSLTKMIDDAFVDCESFKYRHSMMTMFIGTKIIEEAEWGSKELLNKLCFVAMFADISLNGDHLARIQSETELERSDYSDDEKELIRQHALLSAKIVSKVRLAPLGVESIIKQHHGSRTGIGLRMETFNIAPVGLIYMISSEYSSVAISLKETNKKVSKKGFIEYLKVKYGKNPKFKEYIYYFEKINIE